MNIKPSTELMKQWADAANRDDIASLSPGT